MQPNDFEQKLRYAICEAALALHESGMAFAVFADAKCNDEYWHRATNGGFRLLPIGEGITSSAAIRDIFANGWKYATECATAMEIVYYKAILEVYGDELFNKTFNSIYLMDWDIRDPLLQKVGTMEDLGQFGLFPGDRGYFANPDHDPALPQWQGENVIVLENGMYYGHGIGYTDGDSIISFLNSRRKNSNPRSAYLMKKAGRPDFKKLANVMVSGGAMTVWKEFPPAVWEERVEGKNGTVHFV